jgi:ATP synthase protein I
LKASRAVLSDVRKVMGIQAAIVLLSTLLSYVLAGSVTALAVLLGGAIAVVSGGVYALRMLTVKNNEAQTLVRAHYMGEMAKMAVTLLMFAVVFIWYPVVAALPLFLGYVAALLAYWVALYICK